MTPRSFRSPGWRLVEKTVQFTVWAPNEKRTQWKASWLSEDGESGEFAKGATLDEVSMIFPADIAGRFEEVVNGQ